MQAIDDDQRDDPAVRAAPDPVIPGYRIVRRLGLGGMATVYLAVQQSLEREVAVKVMRPSKRLEESQSIRFEQEARVIAKLEHPGIVVIHEVGRTQQGDLYYVMPYLAKGDLSVRDYRDDEHGLIALLQSVLDALDYAHARGIVHRDVKPENILFDNAERPQLADFGIAFSSGGVNSRITGDGLTIGSGAQMSPEQARADSVDGRSDLYNLGVVAYELLTGQLPFESSDPLALALMHAHDPVPTLPAEKSHWQAFVDKAMAKRPEHRFRNAQAMHGALGLIERHVRRKEGAVGRVRQVLNHRPAVLVALGALLAVSVTSVILPMLHDSATQAGHGASATLPLPAAKAEGANAMSERLLDAQQQFGTGALLFPPGANAAESYLEVLRSDPGNLAARTGIEAIFGETAQAIEHSVHENADSEVQRLHAQVEQVADQAGMRENAAFAAMRLRVRKAVFGRIDLHMAELRKGAAADAIALANALGFAGAELSMLAERLQAQPEIGKPIRDPGGPALLAIPQRYAGSKLANAILMMRDEVSRDDYATFAKATARESSRCRNALSPLRLFDRRTWQDPGFRQSGGEPVVCVSVDDALAYARWLGRKTGKKYRLPTRSEWMLADRSSPTGRDACALGNVNDSSAKNGARHSCNDGHPFTAVPGSSTSSALGLRELRGNVAEWSADCSGAVDGTARRSADECGRHAALGLSWRDGPGVKPDVSRALPSDRGYDDVGFRLVRDL